MDDSRWMREFNDLLDELRGGMSFMDLSDREQDLVRQCAEMGYSPSEAFDEVADG